MWIKLCSINPSRNLSKSKNKLFSIHSRPAASTLKSDSSMDWPMSTSKEYFNNKSNKRFPSPSKTISRPRDLSTPADSQITYNPNQTVLMSYSSLKKKAVLLLQNRMFLRDCWEYNLKILSLDSRAIPITQPSSAEGPQEEKGHVSHPKFVPLEWGLIQEGRLEFQLLSVEYIVLNPQVQKDYL